MANLEALKKSRKTDRAAFTKAYNRVEELITLEGVDISELEAELNVLKVKSDRLEITHANILELLPEQDFEAEFEVVEDFRDKKLYGLKQKQEGLSLVNKIIEDSDKFQYLLQSTVEGSRAREVIESFPPTGDNYPKAIDCLKTRFGQQQIRALETLGVTTDKSAALLYPLVESCMPDDFLSAWQRSSNFDLGSDSKKRLDSLLKFLKTEVESEERINLAMTGFGLKDDSSYKNGNNLNKDKMCTAASLLSTSVTAEKLCVFCSGKHGSTNCFKAQKLPYSEKLKILKDKGCCFKCLNAGHRVGKCRCFVKCLICNKMHYAIMCTESNKHVTKPKSNNSEKEIKEQNKSVNMASISNTPQVLLQTLKVKIKGKNCSLTVRAMYDSGSQKSYIRKEIASVLGLAPLRQQLLSHALFGGEKINEEIHNVYKIELGSLDGNFNCNFDIVDQYIICNDVPSVSYGPWIDELKSMNIRMFDIEDKLGPIDFIIGADVAGRLFTGKRRVLSSGLVALESYLGWTIMGKTNLLSEREDTAMMVISMFVREATISDLFSLEVLGISDPVEMKSKKENKYLTKLYFEETVRINEDGRYEVSLPWKGDHLPLPSNKEIAMKRLETSTRKLHHENLFTAYDDVFKEWASLGIIENDPVESSSRHHEQYLPHRPVVKQQGTTKVRPVFDASARQVGSPSLNQCLESGPNLLELIPSLLLRFREHKYGIIADIEKAFLQISVRSEDRNFLKFFWWNGKENVDPKIIRHARVRTIDILLRSFYVDDLITSLDNEAEILPFIEESHHILAEEKFNLRGWKYTGDGDPEQVTSVLGLIWNRREDELKINLDWLETYELEIVSKRVILSVTHRVFDPVGFLCPVLLKSKLMLQKMWKDNIPWDREVEDNMKLEFLKWFEELISLKNLSVRRCFHPASSGQHCISVHTFCDASQFAYAAAVFVRIECADVVQVNLLAATSRVSPVKTITIPRLAATVAARLCRSVLSALQWDNVNQHYWTDSTTVLGWIQREEFWSVFVNNRVQEIRKLTDPILWKHLPGAQNPADLPSRVGVLLTNSHSVDGGRDPNGFYKLRKTGQLPNLFLTNNLF
ncbi:hypothetical protein AVEN_207717-1 [Araneus ventricosus]|uniref:Uncharacterized protein n=1 Tax=Araneus ventricosus TaxID=182803 RepID=A0A4Y2D5D9_ARAVE|nr:hypothetical protein AVEN_15311-1 [Araneus ventricosus]GBM11218.1 hypothetical protein AVEN_207717-1 [Araneus ventricosus]